jgi:hypothetical protein
LEKAGIKVGDIDMSFFRSGLCEYVIKPYEHILIKEIQTIREMGVVGDFLLETDILPETAFSYAALIKAEITFYFGGGVVTIRKKKHKCPTCGVEK